MTLIISPTAERRAQGWYDDIPDVEYHADIGSLSSSGAKLLAHKTPFEFHWAQTHPPVRKREFDLGHASHRLILGKGAEIEILDYANYNTKRSREERDAAYDAGLIPLLVKQHEQVETMATRALEHELGAVLFAEHGIAERSGWWFDERAGIWCRVRPDWMIWIGDVLYIVDVKTCADADPAAFAKAAIRFRYYQQQPWYVGGVRILTGAPRIVFLLFAVSTAPPHLITVHYIDDDADAEGERANRQAMRVFAHCMLTGVWPEYPIDPYPISLPKWHALTPEEYTDDE